jgi:hypothetical protein
LTAPHDDHDTPRDRGTEAKILGLLGVSVPRCVVVSIVSRERSD